MNKKGFPGRLGGLRQPRPAEEAHHQVLESVIFEWVVHIPLSCPSTDLQMDINSVEVSVLILLFRAIQMVCNTYCDKDNSLFWVPLNLAGSVRIHPSQAWCVVQRGWPMNCVAKAHIELACGHFQNTWSIVSSRWGHKSQQVVVGTWLGL